MHKLFFIFLFFITTIASTEEIIQDSLKDGKTKQFLKTMLSSYWKKVGLPHERLDDIFELLTEYGHDGELSMILLHEKYPDMADSSSPFSANYKKARAKKFQAYAKSLLPHIKEGVLLDFGAGDVQLVSTLVGLDSTITQAYATDIFPYVPASTHPKISFLQQATPDSTPFNKESIDTVILSTVLHHITPDVRRSLISHLYSILKPGGRVILVEDSFPLTSPEARNDLEAAFFSLSPKQRKDALCFLDWWGNRLMKNRAEIPLPCTFKTTEEWVFFFKDFNFTPIKNDFEGFPPIYTHMVSPKAILVFEKPEEQNRLKVESISVKRANESQTVTGILPIKGVKINVSIGGTKILTNAVDSKSTILYSSTVYQWRETAPGLSSPKEKRSWIVDQILQNIQEAKENLKEIPIEGVGISWAGPISKEGRVIGPNIIGFSFSDLSPEEQNAGGVDLISLLKPSLPEKWKIQILNDADEEAVSEFSSKGETAGTLLILGTGIGAGFYDQGTVYYGPENYIGRMGEIGHHILFNDKTNQYEYYALTSKGAILPGKSNRFTDRLSAPAISQRFLKFAFRELDLDVKKVFTYLNSQEQLFSLIEITSFFQNGEFPFSLEERVLISITKKAKKGDERAIRFIHAMGVEIGSAFQACTKHFPEKTFLNQIYLAGSLGRLFGKDVYDIQGNEIFLNGIKDGLKPQ